MDRGAADNVALAALSKRQQREIEYHRDHALRTRAAALRIRFDHLDGSERRWWNAYWEMYRRLPREDVAGHKALVMGCGSGPDAVCLAKLGADVSAFDLSLDQLNLARELASAFNLRIDFRQMPAEELQYPADSFDLVLARDILHHCEPDRAVSQIRRVSKPGALIVINEVYTHSWLERIRRTRLFHKWIYPHVVHSIYHGETPYITQDERKLSERELKALRELVQEARWDYFYLFVKRLCSDRHIALCKIDRAMMVALRPLGPLLAGRFVVIGRVVK